MHIKFSFSIHTWSFALGILSLLHQSFWTEKDRLPFKFRWGWCGKISNLKKELGGSGSNYGEKGIDEILGQDSASGLWPKMAATLHHNNSPSPPTPQILYVTCCVTPVDLFSAVHLCLQRTKVAERAITWLMWYVGEMKSSILVLKTE